MQTRRHFIRSLAGTPLLSSLAPSVPVFLARSAVQTSEAVSLDDRVLVVIQLSGGNDGLNTVVPYTDDAYGRSRPTLRLSESEILKIDGELGLHARMPGFERLFKDGRLRILQGLGSEGLSRDHEAALRVWQTAYPGAATAQTGWLGRTADALWDPSFPVTPGVFVGKIAQPLGIHAGTVVVPTLGAREDVFAHAEVSEQSQVGRSDFGQTDGGVSARSLLRHVETSQRVALEQSARFAGIGPTPAGGPEYPDCGLGADLRLAARLIRAELGIRVIYAELGGGGIGGFDNHANQKGNHCALLEQLSAAVTAFVTDLSGDRLLDRVALLTFSEFGRSVAENGRRGTDHGAAGPMFLAGGAVRGGVQGAHPSLTDLDGGAMRHHTDFRRVYATLLEDWLGMPSTGILGGSFERLPLLRAG